MPKKQRRTFTTEFKKQMVQFYENGLLQGEGQSLVRRRGNDRFAKREPASENGDGYFKAGSADHGTKVAIIQNNRDKYSVSAMCDVLKIARSTFYYDPQERATEEDVTEAIVDIFLKNRKAYGTRKLKVKLRERGFIVSRRRIGRIMKEQGLVSTYTVAQYKPQKSSCNEATT